MIYRMVNEERMPQVEDLWDYCFEHKDEPFFQYYFNEYCGKDNMVIGAFEEIGDTEKLRSMLHINPYMLNIRGVKQIAPYIVGVATAPEARGQHLFRPLLETALEVLRAQNMTFVTLMPIYAGIYLPYQFSYCYYRHQYKMPLAQLQPGAYGDGLAVEHIALDSAVLAPLYAKLTAAYNGVPERTPFQWNKLLSVHKLENVQCAVVYRDGESQGYMLYSVADEVFTVIELLAADQQVRNRLLHYAALHQSSAKEFVWLAEAWDKSYLSFADQSCTGSVAPFMMARCLDARRALSQLVVPKTAVDGSVVLLLTDNVIERNNHLLKIDIAPEVVEVHSTMEAEEITMDMGTFTQMYFGTFTATELWEAGKIKATSLHKLQLLDELFPKCRTYINEYF